MSGLLAILLVLEGSTTCGRFTDYNYCRAVFTVRIFWTVHARLYGAPWSKLESIVNLMFFSTDGILGTPLAVSATYIFAFLLFGAFLVKTGVGQYFNDLAVAVAGKLIGGPAKVAIFSSALQGTISGSSVANVVTSGSYTIPMMKRLGYNKEFRWCSRGICFNRWSVNATNYGCCSILNG